MALKDLPALLSPGIDDPRIVVIIDELDRCRPDFALGIVESLKHFFTVPNIHFLLVTNLQHLEMSVAYRYGLAAHSREYLEKFYDFVITFGVQYDKNTTGQFSRFIAKHCDNLIVGNSDMRSDIAEYVKEVAPAFNLSLRQIELMISNLALIYSTKSDNEKFDNFVVVFILILKLRAPALYAKARDGSLSYAKAAELFNTADWRDEHTRERVLKIFEFYLSENIDTQSEEWQGFNMHYRIGRKELIPYYCKSVIERFSARKE